MIRNTSLPAAKPRRLVCSFACLMLAGVFPLMLLHAQQPATTPPAPTPPPSGQQPATPPSQSPADQQSDQPDAGAPTIRAIVNEVNLIFTVTDKHGHYIP